MTTLRDYQVVARDRVFEEWAAGLRRTALVLPTGAGKTVVFSEIIRQFIANNPGEKVLILAHREELLTQAAEKISHWAPDLRVGLVQGKTNQISAQVIVASQQTLARPNRRRFLPRFGLIIVDECHRCMSPTYAKTLEALGSLDPDGPLTLGVTATFMREDSKRLTDFFESVAFSMDILDLIAGEVRYLVPPKFKRVLIEGLDLSGIPISRLEGGKDLAAGELGEAMDKAGAPGVVAEAYRLHAGNRSGMIFCPTVASATHVAEAMRLWGFTAEMLCGETPKYQRRDILARYNRGEIQVITNANLLGEGVDAPITGCIVIARPTMSKILFRQMVGRGLRLHPGKTDCLVLDVVGATGRNDLKTLNDVTDHDVHVREMETLDDAVARERPTEPREETQEGEALVSGSLLAIDIDPWEIEASRGAPVKKYKLSAEEKEAARLAREEERARAKAEREEKEAQRLKRRYKHVPMRSAWFLRTLHDRWFIAIDSATGQQGFICSFETAVGWIVALKVDGVEREELGRFDDEGTAAQLMMRMTLGLVEQAVDRYKVDPDARWRRKPASDAAIEMATNFVGPDVDFEEYHYSGQVSDFITWGQWHRKVDQFADKITAQVNESATMQLAQ